MKSFVLMNKKTGDLLLGTQVRFVVEPKMQVSPMGGDSWVIALHESDYDGWIVEHPKFGAFRIFFNRKFDEMTEVLSEL